MNFNENDSNHLEALNYLTNYAGHPIYIINDEEDDLDIGFRNFLMEKFELDEDFCENCNGSEHKLIKRNNDIVSMEAYFSYEASSENCDYEITFNYDAEIIMQDDNSIIGVYATLKPIENTIKMVE